jgi:hypothetical protein
MKRYAAHFLFVPPDQVFQLHVIELDDTGRLLRIFPLDKEIERTAFYNGILLASGQALATGSLQQTLQEHPDVPILQLLKESNFPAIKEGDTIYLYVLDGVGINLLSPKF